MLAYIVKGLAEIVIYSTRAWIDQERINRVWIKDSFIKQLKDMCSREKENKFMGLIDVKEEVIKTLGEFLERNKEYTVEVLMIQHSKKMIRK